MPFASYTIYGTEGRGSNPRWAREKLNTLFQLSSKWVLFFEPGKIKVEKREGWAPLYDCPRNSGLLTLISSE